jgi:STIP1 family protein 1
MAYELCSRSVGLTSSAFAISGFVLRCKKAKWELRERDRLHRRSELLAEMEDRIAQDRNREVQYIEDRRGRGEMGEVAAREETEQLEQAAQAKVDELRTVFAIADPNNLQKRVSEDDGNKLLSPFLEC